MVAEQLIHLVQERMEHGDKLPSERELMEQLDVGRSSIREALRALEIMGLIETRTGGGTFVTKANGLLFKKPLEWGVFSTEKSVMDLVEARTLFEIAIIETAAKRIKNDELEQLEAIVEQMEKILPPNRELLLNMDLQFHMKIVQSIDNDVVSETIKLIIHTLERERTMSVKLMEDFKKIAGYHRKILDALKTKDPSQAKAAMIEHMQFTESLFSGELRERKQV